MTEYIINKGMEIECIGNPAQQTQFRIFCEDPHHDDMMVGLPADGRKFSNWADVIYAATSQAQSRIVKIEVVPINELRFERDELEKVSDFEKVAGAVIGILLVFAVYMVFTTMRGYVPVGFMG